MLYLIHKQWDLIKSHQMQLQTAMPLYPTIHLQTIGQANKIFVQYFYFK